MRSLAALVLVLAVFGSAHGGDAPQVVDQWYIGDLNGQPAVSLHLLSTPTQGGGRSTLAEMAVVLRRPLGGKEFRIEIRQRQELTEDEAGRIVRFRIDHDENGTRTSAIGTIADGRALAEVAHLGRIDKQEIIIPEGVEILGQIAGQERMAAAVANAKEGEKPAIGFAGVELVSHRVALIRSTARFVATESDGNLRFTVTSDVLPVPTTAVVTRRGDLVRMAVDLTLFKIEVRRADGPVALLGATIDATGLVASKGPSPKGGDIERYRVPAGATVAIDEFQSRDGDTVSVRREAVASELADAAPFLAREPQLEIDDPQMRAWVEGIATGQSSRADLAETLRLAVRSHITARDLNTADGTALDTFRNKRGDCTEHANLLCAALRIAGIPARVDVGIVHSIDHGAWVGHAWVSAWIDGAWRHLDAAYPGVPRSRYLRLGSSTGHDGAKTAGAMIAALASLMGREIECVVPGDSVPRTP
ncbi:MAG: transglutaminase domain-containing protein [Planctomycetes bacterium]|nr:transglutaminase domain-containing protein [Planctomycetota bacterium]